MFSVFEWMMALRYLRARRQEGFISVIAWFSLLGIALGVSTLIIVMSVMNGFREELMSRILGINGHLSIYAESDGLTGFDDLADKIRKLEGVIGVSPIIEGQVMVSAKKGASGAVVRGFRKVDLKARSIVADNIKKGSLENFDNNSVIIGTRLARKLGVAVGHDVTLISPKGNVTAFGVIPRMRKYKLAATFDIGMYEYDSGFIFMPLPAAQIYFRMPNTISNLEVFVDHPDNALAIGLEDRGLIKEGMKADINIIDFDNLTLYSPEIRYDLPADGKRLVQRVDGYKYTIVSGKVTYKDGVSSGELPGRLIRS